MENRINVTGYGFQNFVNISYCLEKVTTLSIRNEYSFTDGDIL